MLPIVAEGKKSFGVHHICFERQEIHFGVLEMDFGHLEMSFGQLKTLFGWHEMGFGIFEINFGLLEICFDDGLETGFEVGKVSCGEVGSLFFKRWLVIFGVGKNGGKRGEHINVFAFEKTNDYCRDG